MTVGVFGLAQSQWGDIQWGAIGAAPSVFTNVDELTATAASILALRPSAFVLLSLTPSGTPIIHLTASAKETP